MPAKSSEKKPAPTKATARPVRKSAVRAREVIKEEIKRIELLKEEDESSDGGSFIVGDSSDDESSITESDE